MGEDVRLGAEIPTLRAFSIHRPGRAIARARVVAVARERDVVARHRARESIRRAPRWGPSAIDRSFGGIFGCRCVELGDVKGGI